MSGNWLICAAKVLVMKQSYYKLLIVDAMSTCTKHLASIEERLMQSNWLMSISSGFPSVERPFWWARLKIDWPQFCIRLPLRKNGSSKLWKLRLTMFTYGLSILATWRFTKLLRRLRGAPPGCSGRNSHICASFLAYGLAPISMKRGARSVAPKIRHTSTIHTTAAKAARVAFLLRIKFTGLSRSRTVSCPFCQNEAGLERVLFRLPVSCCTVTLRYKPLYLLSPQKNQDYS